MLNIYVCKHFLLHTLHVCLRNCPRQHVATSLYRHVIRDLILPTYGRAAPGNAAPGRKRGGTVSVKRRAWRRERPASIKKRFGSHEITRAFYRGSSIFVPLSGPRRWTDRRDLPLLGLPRGRGVTKHTWPFLAWNPTPFAFVRAWGMAWRTKRRPVQTFQE